MKVIQKIPHEMAVTRDLENVLEIALQDTTWGNDAVSNAQETARKTATAVAKLVAALVEAERLTLSQAEDICDVRGSLSAVSSRDFIGG